MRVLLAVLVMTFSVPTPLVWAAGPSPDTLALLKSLEGQKKWLRITVVRLQGPLSGSDTTNVYADGHVRYQSWGTESTSVDEFTKDVQRSLQSSDATMNWRVRVVEEGSPVTITKAEAKDKNVELELRDSGGSKHKIRFKFEEGRYSYTPEALKPLFALTFADTEAEARGEKPTVTIKLGMTIDEVLAAKGPGKTRVELGSKTILAYDDFKFVFENGLLRDVQ